MKSDINIAFCVDKGALVGLHITLASLLHHFDSSGSIAIHLVYEGLSQSDLDLISKTIERSGKNANLKKMAIDGKIFSSFDKFVGGRMVYARLFLSDFLEIERVIYLDADLIVGTDVTELWAFDLGKKTMGAVTWHTRLSAHDSDLFLELGEDMNKPYFNSGVLLMELKRMRDERFLALMKDAANALRGKLISHDQSLLNLCFFDQITALSRRFNTIISPRRRIVSAETANNRILHLVARPKPWDLFGKLNGQHNHYVRYRAMTALPEHDLSSSLNARNMYKVLRSFRAYIKCLHRTSN